MGLKDMFKLGPKQVQGSPKASPKPSPMPSPKTSRSGSPPKWCPDDKQTPGTLKADSQRPSQEEQRAPRDELSSKDHGGEDKVAELEQELSKSRWEAMMMRDKIAELEHKVESGGSGWETFSSEEQRQKEDEDQRARQALEDRNKQLRDKVRDLQEELERTQEKRSARSSLDDKSQNTAEHALEAKEKKQTSDEVHVQADDEKKQMAAKIKQLEDLLEARKDTSFDGMAAQIKALEAQLEDSKEDLDEVVKERDELKEALQDADDRLESVEAAGAENNMHSISRVKEMELKLVETLEKLKRAETAAAIAEHAFEELQRRSELDEAGLQEEKGKRRHRRAHEQIQGAKQGKENEDTGATSADTVSDFEDDSVALSKSEHSADPRKPHSRTRPKDPDRRIVPKHSSKNSPAVDPAQQLKAMFEESDESRQNSPRTKSQNDSRSHRNAVAHNLPASAYGNLMQSPDASQRDSLLSLSQSEGKFDSDSGAGKGGVNKVREGHLRALEAERAKNKLLEIKVAAYEQRMEELESMMQLHDVSGTGRSGYRHSPGGPSILDRTDKWVHRRKAEPEQRTREEIEEDIFKAKVELAKSKLKSNSSHKVPDLGKSYPWEKPSVKPKKKGISQERPISPSQRKHFSTTHLKSNVTQSDAGIAGPQPPQREAVRSLKTDRSWNPTQLEGSKFGFTPNVSEKSPPRVTIIAPDKVTGGDKAPWLVECHPEYDSRELWNMGVGRSKKLFDGQGFKEGSHWPEHKKEELGSYQQRQDIYETKGHYRGAPMPAPDAAGCPSTTPSGANIKVFREQYGDMAGKGEWYDAGSRGLKTAYVDHAARKTQQSDERRRCGKLLSQTKVAQLSGPSPFGLDSQAPQRVQEDWNMDRSPAPFGRDDEVGTRRKAWN